MVRFGSIRVSGPLSAEHISGVGSGMGLGRSVRVSGLFCQLYSGPHQSQLTILVFGTGNKGLFLVTGSSFPSRGSEGVGSPRGTKIVTQEKFSLRNISYSCDANCHRAGQ